MFRLIRGTAAVTSHFDLGQKYGTQKRKFRNLYEVMNYIAFLFPFLTRTLLEDCIYETEI